MHGPPSNSKKPSWRFFICNFIFLDPAAALPDFRQKKKSKGDIVLQHSKSRVIQT